MGHSLVPGRETATAQQHPTSNIEHPTSNDGPRSAHWMLDVSPAPAPVLLPGKACPARV
ncbi:MAG TPA: hypothetical protein VMU04_00035 [Candidatus Acidoferrum sp.]|nr:hypothetical protein [Candidatus Acidoferrum sp.]